MLSNTDDTVDADRISSGHVCVYEIEMQDQDSEELLEIVLEQVKNAKIGFDFVQNNITLVDTGFLNRDNCSMEANNCTKNMRGKHVYYLSGVNKLYLTVLSTAIDTQNAELGETSFDIDFEMREKTASVLWHIGITMAILALFIYGFTKGVKWMESQQNQHDSEERDEDL